MKTIRLRTSRSQLYSALRNIPKELTNRRSESELGNVFLNHLAHSFFTDVATNYEKKSDGGTDEFGRKWEPLKPETIAQRPITQGEYRKAGVRPGERGILTVFQNAIWKGIFATTYKRLRLEYDDAKAKALAGTTAWAVIKSLGGKTKLGVFGNRKVRILRVSDRLFRSVSPGRLVGNRYYPPYEQVFEVEGNTLEVGSTVPYAGRQSKRRPILPTVRELSGSGFLKRTIVKARGSLITALEKYLRDRSTSLYRSYRRNR